MGLCIREMEGHVLVTHDGRRLAPTEASLTHLSEESDGKVATNVVLRVYSSTELDEAKDLYCKMS